MAPTETRPEVILAALLYLITAYHRSPSRDLAACIARHFRYLAQHPRADRLVCDVAAASTAEWEAASHEAPVTVTRKATFLGFALH